MVKIDTCKTEIQKLCKDAIAVLNVAKQKNIISNSEFEKISMKKKMFIG